VWYYGLLFLVNVEKDNEEAPIVLLPDDDDAECLFCRTKFSADSKSVLWVQCVIRQNDFSGLPNFLNFRIKTLLGPYYRHPISSREIGKFRIKQKHH
jgi:hypothetical protein